MKRYCLALDLKEDDQLIAAYEAHHRAVWPEVIASVRDAGILSMEIFRFANRLFMIMETKDDFSFEAKSVMDAENVKVQEWERLMWRFQQPLPGVPEGTKWVLLDKIFDLNRS